MLFASFFFIIFTAIHVVNCLITKKDSHILVYLHSRLLVQRRNNGIMYVYVCIFVWVVTEPQIPLNFLKINAYLSTGFAFYTELGCPFCVRQKF